MPIMNTFIRQKAEPTDRRADKQTNKAEKGAHSERIIGKKCANNL